jgi:hypothetical protein
VAGLPTRALRFRISNFDSLVSRAKYLLHSSATLANLSLKLACHADPVHHMTETAYSQQRRFPRVTLPKGMPVAWHGSDLQLFSRVRTIGMGGLFISTPNPAPVGTKLLLAFEVPGGNVRPEAIVRNVAPGQGMGVEFTRLELKEQLLLQNLMNRLLRDPVA